MGHALVLEEPEASPEGGLFLGGVVELNLVKAGEEVEGGEPVATTLAEGVGDVGKRVMVLGGNFVKGAQVNDDAVATVGLLYEHGPRAEGTPTRRNELRLDLLVDDLLEGCALLGTLGPNTNAWRWGRAYTVRRLQRGRRNGMADGVGVARRATETAAVSLKQIADSVHFLGVGFDLRPKVNLTHQIIASVLWRRYGGRVPVLKFGKRAELRYAHGKIVGVEHRQGYGAVISDTGDSTADENVQLAAPSLVVNPVEQDEGPRRHRGRNLYTDNHLKAMLGHLDILGRESKGPDGSGKRLRLKNLRR